MRFRYTDSSQSILGSPKLGRTLESFLNTAILDYTSSCREKNEKQMVIFYLLRIPKIKKLAIS